MRLLKKKLQASEYQSDERGSILVFVLVVFTVMFLVGGTAVDLARHETLRSTLQYNLDRAVLAAASLKQTQEPEDVVNDYMDKIATIEEFSIVVSSDIGLSSRSVSATATADLNTWFLRMAGIDEMPIVATSTASEEIPKLEIALVLDVSGSMSSNSKLSNLKTAAKDFVTTMLGDADDDTVAISVVPFNSSAAPSETIFDALNVTETHTYSTCLDFTDADFANVAIDPTVAQTQQVYTSAEGEGNTAEFGELGNSRRSCFNDEYFEILPYSDDVTALHTKIDSFEAAGYTAGHQGIKWGLALLDPAFQPVTTALIAAAEVDAGFSSIPVAYDDSETVKVIIMMGDGANTYEYRLGSSYTGPNSDLWEVVFEDEVFDYAYHKFKTWKTSTDESKCSRSKWVCVYTIETQTKYYVHKQSNSRYYDADNTSEYYTQSQFDDLETTLTGWYSTTQLDWEIAWGKMSTEFYDDVVGGSGATDDYFTYTGRQASEEDVVMASACSAARVAGVVVYTIGFETNTSTSAKLEACATTNGHFYQTYGTEILDVFAAIASSIQKLKLTQ
ncbi:MAG: VWA domain-containing protein [Rhodobacteraceae bacterium]|nr:VWA domain-containing protein [Paracoccaceae bacterium]